MDENAVRMVGWDCFSELLYGPLSSGMRRDIDVHESAACLFNDHQDVEDAKRRRDHHAEVTRHDALGLVADKG